MTRRHCDRCGALMPTNPGESTSFILAEPGDEATGARQWAVTVTAPRDRDLCIPCRKLIVSNGKP